MWHDNVDLLAYHDLDGPSGLKLALQEVDGRFFLYVAGFLALGLEHPGGDQPRAPRAAPLARWATQHHDHPGAGGGRHDDHGAGAAAARPDDRRCGPKSQDGFLIWDVREPEPAPVAWPVGQRRNRHFRSTTDRKSTRLNSSHLGISY